MKSFILFLLIFIFCSCSKTDDGFEPTLPPITETGENTFGCLVNGRLLVPRDGSGSFNVHDAGLIFWGSPNDTYDEIDVHDFASEKTASINLHIIGLHSFGAGKYVVNESNCYDGIDSPKTTNIFCRVWDYKDEIYKYYCSFENSGVIKVTRYELENRIISGTFSGKVISYEDITDTIEITKGRFDIKWDRLPTNFP